MANQYVVILRATNDNQEKFDLEVVDSPQFLLDISAIQSNDIGKVYGISSQEFTLPGNQQTNQFFNNLFDLGTTPAVGLTHTVPCQVLVNGQAVYTGKLYINNIVTDQYNNITYNCVVVNETVDFRTRIDNRALIDLDWSAYNHTYSWTAISQSWNDQLLNGDVFYPLIHYGKDPNNPNSSQVEFGGKVGQIDNINSPLRVTDFKPAIRAKAVLDTVFNTVGYRYTSSFLDSNYFKDVYLLTTNNEYKGANMNNLVTQSAYVYRTTNQTIPQAIATTVQFDAEVYDNGNNYNPATFTYTADVTGTYTINVSIPFLINSFSGLAAGRSATIEVFQNGSSPLNAYTANLANVGAGTIGFTPFSVQLNANDTVTVAITFDGTTSETFRVKAGTDTFLKVQGPPSTVGGAINMGLQFPSDLKITDFIQGLINKYNLVIEPVVNSRNLLKIEPFNDWVDQGVIVDWTDKVDRSVKFEITHPLGDQPKTIKFTDKTDEDVINKYQNTTFKNIYGEYNYSSDSDLTTGTKTIETIFAATPVKPIPGSFTTVMPFLYKQDTGKYGQPFKFNPRLLHKQSLKTVNAFEAQGISGSVKGYYYMNDGSVTFPINYYRTLGGLTESPATFGTTFDIHFDNLDFYPYQQSYTNGRTSNDAFTKYWAFYINELYDVDTRLLTCNIVLNPSEIQNIQLNSKIFIDGHYYRINKIQGANLIDQQSTQVELLKTLPRKLYFPRRRIYTDPEIFVDVVQGDLLNNGSTYYTYYQTGQTVNDPYIVGQASARDGNIAYSSSVIWDQTKPIIYNPNIIVVGPTNYDETSTNVISVGDNGTIPQQTTNTALFFPTVQLDTYNTGTVYIGNSIVQNSAQFTGSVDITGSLCVNGDCWPFGGGSGSAATASYISVFDTTDQTLQGALTASVMTFNNTDFSNGITLISGSRFTVSQSGVYNIEFSAQFDKTNSSNSTAYIWLRKNGVDVADTNTSITLGGGTNDRAVAAWNFYVSASAGDYYQLAWTATNANTYLQAVAAVPGVLPGIPSIIATIGSIDKAGPQGPAGPSGSFDTGSFATTGSNVFIGTETISGSLNISGSGTLNGTPMVPQFNATSTTLDFTGATSIGGGTFDTLYLAYTNFTFANVQLTNVNDIQYIGSNAFQNHQSLTGSITFNKLKYIGYNGFRQSSTDNNCPSFVGFTAPSCSRVGYTAFQNNRQLISASIGTSTTLEFIGPGCFNGCVKLKYVNIPTLSGSLALGGSTGNNFVFGSVANSGSIIIPSFYSSSNAGAPDGDLNDLITTYGWTVTYV